ncbi:MAG TPA: hemolysin [Prolixibacteraceae bacterium]|nr:hemolysin [Prolixibacteraceae bacterium]
MLTDILITLILVSFNGFFVAAEFAIVKVRSSQIEVKVKEGVGVAVLAKHIVSHLDGYLAATQLGITLASLGLGWIGEPVVSKIIINLMNVAGIEITAELAHQIALPVAFVIITILHIVFGELAPKSMAIQRPEKVTLFIAYPLQFFFFVFRPFIWLLNGIANLLLKSIGISSVHGSEIHSSEELKYLVEQGQQSGKIDEDEYKIIRNAFDFSEQTVKQIMVPRIQVFAVDINNFGRKTLEKIIEENYSRIPVYDGNIDNILGVVYLKDLLIATLKTDKPDIRDLIRTMIIVPDSKNIGKLLNEFQVRHQQMALVVNEYGGTEGIITMEDILEELVGEIQDEYDNEIPFVEKTAEKIYQVMASASIDDINEMLPHPVSKDKKYETLAGLLIFKFGKIPNVRERIQIDDYEFIVLKRSKSSVLLVQMNDLL